MRTENEIIRTTTNDYLDKTSPLPDINTIEQEILEQIRYTIQAENVQLPKGYTYKPPKKLPYPCIAACMQRLYKIKQISFLDNPDARNAELAIYQEYGKDKGIYITDENYFANIIRQFDYRIDKKGIQEVLTILKEEAEVVTPCNDPDLIAVNNGIFNYKTKRLDDFDPEVVFTCKSHVNYFPVSVNPVLHNDEDGTDWDVESWINDLSDNPEIVELIWQMLGAIIRPNVNWDKAIFLYSEQGNNGKGSLCELMRNLCGSGNYASISINSFAKQFTLTALTRVSAVITDENPTGAFTKEMDSFKCAVTGDTFVTDRKYEQPIMIRFRGLIVQCINDLPRTGDRTESFYRRQLFIPFEKCFTGKERKYIKHEYLRNPEVLEYVLHKVLHSDFYEFIEPEACRMLKEEYKETNDPVRQFLTEILPELAWDLAPWQFLYDLYREWCTRNIPSGQCLSKDTFIREVRNILIDDTDWHVTANAVPPSDMMDSPEPLIATWNLSNWKSPAYNGYDIVKMCRPPLKSSYKGILRNVRKGVGAKS